MYPVSQSYIDKLKSKDTKIRRIRGYVDSVAFTENDVLDGSFSYTDMCVKSSEIKLGGVFIATLNLTFLQSFVNRFPRGSWKDRVITCSIGLFLGYDANEQEIWESVPVKPYIIDDPQHSELGLDVVAYDAMHKFDKPIEMTTTSGNLFGMATLACNACGVTLGMTSEEMAALPNGDQILGLYPDSDIETWHDLISWIAVTIGGFATINRDGELVFRAWKNGQNADIEIGVNDRFTGGIWSDFSTNYSAVQLTNMEDGTPMYYAVTPDNGLTMDLGSNPLLQYGIPDVREAQCRNILNAIQNLKYVPFSSTSLIDPALDLGDVILYSDGIADDAVCCVMRMDFSFSKGATVKGYGKNPAQSGAKTPQDKAIAQAAKGSKAQGITYYPYINTTAVSLTTTAQRLYRIAFATADTTDVELWHEVKWNVTAENNTPVEITYEYYLDGVKFDYEPVDTWTDGYHSMPHPYWLLEVSGGETHYWEVKAKINGGSAVASIGDIHALLKGQKLVGSVKFDGNIEITETYEPFTFGLDTATFVDTPVISKIAVNPNVTASDVFEPFTFGLEVAPLVDTQVLTAQTLQYTRVTEDGNTRVTEEGDVRLTEV